MTLYSFSGPQTLKTPHARLVYLEYENTAMAWSHWQIAWSKLDQFIEHSDKFEKASQKLFFYFFSDDKDSKAWVGMEVVGHDNLNTSEFSTFDSYSSEVFSWDLSLKSFFEIEISGLFNSQLNLRALAPAALAQTWRIEFDFSTAYDAPSMDDKENKSDFTENLASVAFQFFKSH